MDTQSIADRHACMCDVASNSAVVSGPDITMFLSQ